MPTGDTDAYELYLKGLHFFNRLQIQQAIDHLKAATEKDEQFARAYAALAVAYAVPAAHSDLHLPIPVAGGSPQRKPHFSSILFWPMLIQRWGGWR